jgi:hypothetical protein
MVSAHHAAVLATLLASAISRLGQMLASMFDLALTNRANGDLLLSAKN